MAGFDTDIAIVGGGPAGLAAALAARRKGFRVTVADYARPPIDKACGEGLLPDGIAILEGLGVRFQATDGYPFTGIRFLDGGRSAAASFPGRSALGIRRTTLHSRMVRAAEDAGIRLLWGTGVTALGPDGVCFGRTLLRARWIIGADGAQSRVRAWAGLDSPARLRRRFGFRRHYRIRPWTDRMEVYWADGLQVYVTPVGEDEICVVALSDDPHLRLEEALDRIPDILARLDGAATVTTERGAVSASCRLRRVWRDHVALVGDASGSVDAVTGEGLCLSFRQSLALADALAAGDLAQYQAEHRRILRRAERIAGLLLSMGSRRWLRRRTFRLLAAYPSVFSKFLALHMGTLAPLWSEPC